jgi:ribulose bisphosphate carboxylase small subunit
MSRKFANEKARAKHQEAVKLRKMTDEQLTETFNSLYQDGFNDGIEYKAKELKKIQNKITKIKGIGPKTQSKIITLFEEMAL